MNALKSEQHRVNVDIYGEKYTIKGDAAPDYIAEVANLVDRRMRELQQSSAGSMTKSRLAVLTALNVADELMQIRHTPQEDNEILNRTRQLITLLDEGLIGDVIE